MFELALKKKFDKMFDVRDLDMREGSMGVVLQSAFVFLVLQLARLVLDKQRYNQVSFEQNAALQSQVKTSENTTQTKCLPLGEERVSARMAAEVPDVAHGRKLIVFGVLGS